MKFVPDPYSLDALARPVGGGAGSLTDGRTAPSRARLRKLLCDELRPAGHQQTMHIHWNTIHVGRGNLQIAVTIPPFSFLVTLSRRFDGQAVLHSNVIERGTIVSGVNEDEEFGKWNRIVAVDDEGSVLDIFPGHGGEFYPGSLNDHVEALRARVVRGRIWPVQADLDISNACTGRCSWCFSAHYRQVCSGATSGELLSCLICDLAEGGTKIVRFDGGGEPLTHPHIMKLTRLAHDLDMKTAVLTNGDLLDDRHARVFVDTKTYVRISFNASCNATRLIVHRPFHPAHDFDSLAANVARLVRLREQRRLHDGGRPSPLIGATFLICAQNYGEICQTARIVKELGINHLSFRRILGPAHAAQFSDKQIQEIKSQLHRVCDEVADDRFVVFVPWRDLTDRGLKPSEHFDRCLACTHRTVIEVDRTSRRANVALCGRHRGLALCNRGDAVDCLVLGRYDGTKPLSDVLLDPRMKEGVQRVPAACSDCIDRGANLVFNWIHDALERDPHTRFLKFAAPADAVSSSAADKAAIVHIDNSEDSHE